MKDRFRREVLLIPALLVCVVCLLGCTDEQAQSPGGDIRRVTASADKRAGLFKQLDRKFQKPDVHYALGQSFRSDGLWTQAEYHFETALGFDPAHRATQAAITKLLQDSGRGAEADTRAKMYVAQIGDSWKETLKLGNAFHKEKVDKYALTCYQQAVRLSPESPAIYKDMGYYYLSKNEEEVAKDCFKQSFHLDPMQPEVAGELGRLGVEVRVPRKADDRSEKSG